MVIVSIFSAAVGAGGQTSFHVNGRAVGTLAAQVTADVLWVGNHPAADGRSCGALVGYRSTPTAQAGKYLYVHPEHLTEFQPSAMHTSDAAVASHESAASAHADDDGPSAAIP